MNFRRIGRLRKGLSTGESASEMLDVTAGAAQVRLMTDSYLGLLKFLAPTAKRIVTNAARLVGFVALLFPNARIVIAARSSDTLVSA